MSLHCLMITSWRPYCNNLGNNVLLEFYHLHSNTSEEIQQEKSGVRALFHWTTDMFSLLARSLLKLHLTPCPFPQHSLPALPIKCIDVPCSDLVSLGQNGNHDMWQSSSWFVKHEIRGMWQRKQLLVHKFKTSTRPLLELPISLQARGIVRADRFHVWQEQNDISPLTNFPLRSARMKETHIWVDSERS